MNYEKKYKEALERARELLGDMNKKEYFASNGDIENIFPELQESEDERIRKAIIDYLKKHYEGSTIGYGVQVKEVIAWLEKHGQSEVTKTSDQELSDKIETKIKAGDWIVINETTYQIIEIDNSHVALSFNGRECNFGLDVFNNARLWTIQDAKDGDVLCYHVSATTFFLIGIFKRVAHKDELWGGTYRNYAQYGGYGSIENYTLQVALGNDELHHCGSIACPATKEQRDLLFQKMKEAGYEWDSEKKELKKIEPKKVNADKVIEWLKGTIRETKEYLGEHGEYYYTHLTLPYDSIEDLINNFKEDFGL